MAKKIVIVGGVAGGATVIARLRKLDERAEIVLLSLQTVRRRWGIRSICSLLSGDLIF